MSSGKCRHCAGRLVVRVEAHEIRTVRVADSPTTVVEMPRLYRVLFWIPCRCVGGIRTINVGRPEKDYCDRRR